MSMTLKAPFPAFGGKSRVTDLVWSRLGPVRNYVEPFCFSLAMLLGRPDEPQIETVNDLNPFVSNFWRAIQRDPELVAYWADWPVNETDLHARHRWLLHSRKARVSLERVKRDPDYFDAKIAGWWCWGACMWIGSGWCDAAELRIDGLPREKSPLLGKPNGGVGCLVPEQIPELSGDNGTGRKDHSRAGFKRLQLCNGSTRFGQGVHREPQDVPMSGRGSAFAGDGEFGIGQGVNKGLNKIGRPQLADAYARGRGIHGNDALTDCARRRLWLIDWFARLADRLRPVRVCCGHWSRICDSDSTLTRLGLTAAFLDPPYRKRLACGTENRAAHIYANDKTQDVDALCDEVQAWCLKWGGSPDIRVALCGLEGEYPAIEAAGWDCVPWKSRGGYGNRTDRGKENAARERIWFSPACLSPKRERQSELFSGG